jgi:hypothetical protein
MLWGAGCYYCTDVRHSATPPSVVSGQRKRKSKAENKITAAADGKVNQLLHLAEGQTGRFWATDEDWQLSPRMRSESGEAMVEHDASPEPGPGRTRSGKR